MSGCRIIKAHNHEAIAERVQNTISGAADDIAQLYMDATRSGMGAIEFRRRAHEIIMKRAYYGDAAMNGEVTEEQLQAVHEYAHSPEALQKEVDEVVAISKVSPNESWKRVLEIAGHRF
jgi:hypothetical protein